MPWASVGDSVSCGLNEAPWVIGNPVTSDRQDFGASPLAAPPRGSRNQPSCLLILFAFRFGLIVVFLPTHKFSPYLTKSKPSPLKQDVTLRPCPNCSPINRVMSHFVWFGQYTPHHHSLKPPLKRLLAIMSTSCINYDIPIKTCFFGTVTVQHTIMFKSIER